MNFAGSGWSHDFGKWIAWENFHKLPTGIIMPSGDALAVDASPVSGEKIDENGSVFANISPERNIPIHAPGRRVTG